MQPSIENQIRQWLAVNILFSDGDIPASDHDSFLDNGLIDSLGVMELVNHLKTEYRLDVAPLDVTPENFDSVSRVAAYIRCKQGQPVATDAAPPTH